MFIFRTIAYLSLFLFSISTTTTAAPAAPAIQFIHPNNVVPGDLYSLTLSTNPTRILLSISGAFLDVETFNALDPWNAENVGPKSGRRWRFMNGMQSLLSVQTTKYLRFIDSVPFYLKTDSSDSKPDRTHISLVVADGLQGTGIQIRILNDRDYWVDENGNVGQTRDRAAVWMITKTA